MSIRTRVMVGTLGLAVIGFVGTLGAAEDEIVVVRDGSVDLNVINSRLSERDADRKHKWSKKADTVAVFEDKTAAAVCSTSKVNPIRFERVVLKIKDLTTPQDITIVAANEGAVLSPKKLKFLMPEEWRFVFRAFDYRLVFGAPPNHQIRNVKLAQVEITPEAGGKLTTYPEPASTETFLCVKFRDD
jgi:hypothetical protein